MGTVYIAERDDGVCRRRVAVNSASARRLFREAYEMQREVLVPGAPALRAVTRQLAALGDTVGHR